MIFVKAPRAGFVKSRIAATLGTEKAREIYVEIMGVLIANLRGIPRVQLRFTPDDARGEVADWLQPGWSASAQGEGDLGQRLQNAFASLMGPAVVIGSDCPQVTQQDIKDAWEGLVDHDVVLGPAEDGGYWLVGLRAPAPHLFENIAWSSERVLEQTLEKTAGLKVKMLRKLPDIDTAKDWERFLARNAHSPIG